MPLASLYETSLNRVYYLLKQGVWKACNFAFSNLPTTVVDDLMELTLAHDEDDPPNTLDVLPLLISGRLTRLNFCVFDMEAERDALLRIIHDKTDDPLPIPDLLSEKFVMLTFVKEIILLNPYLEELHLNIRLDFEIFRECPKLRILRFYQPPEQFLANDFPINLNVLSSLKNLEVLHIPNMDTEVIANVLDYCPKLISIGLVDCLNSIEQQKPLLNLKNGHHYQLRRCVWGKKTPEGMSNTDNYAFKNFCRNISWAVKLCCLVEELIIHLPDKDALKELKNLKKLNLLRINFCDCDDDFVPEFVEVLQDIGPHLKHLSIICLRPVPVDVICEFCPSLESLEIEGPTFMENPFKTSTNLPLRRLRFATLDTPEDENSFVFLISNSKYLEELFVENATFFDDSLLTQIFELNPLQQLKVSYVEDSSLTSEGYHMFMQKPAFVETVNVISVDAEYFFDAFNLFKDPNRLYIEYVDIKQDEFFNRKLNENRF